MRIISLLPSLTEIVAALDLGDSLVGITHSCDYPPETVAGKLVVTSTEVSPYTMSQEEIHKMVSGTLANGHSLYGLDAGLIEASDADVILTQALCDVYVVQTRTRQLMWQYKSSLSFNADAGVQSHIPRCCRRVQGCLAAMRHVRVWSHLSQQRLKKL